MTLRSRVRIAVCVLVSTMLSAGEVFALDETDSRKIVMFADGVSRLTQELTVTLTGGTIVHVLSVINALAVQLPLGGIASAIDSLLRDPNVLGVFDDPFGSLVNSTPLTATTGEEYFDWGLARIGVPEAQNETGATGVGVTVAILDTGIDPYHSELSQRVIWGYSAVPGQKSFTDPHGHGTHIAGIIAAAADGKGIVGAAPEAKLAAVRVLDQHAEGRVSDLIDGLQYAQKKGIRLVNMSLGFTEASVPLERAIERFYEKGMIMVAAVGNCNSGDGGGDEGGDGGDEGEDSTTACDPSQTGVRYPARYPWVIAVAATDYDNRVAYYSLSGTEVTVAAPGGAQSGERILSTAPGGGYSLSSGTSQATAHAVGAVTLALQRNANLTFEQVRDLLQDTALNLGYPETQQGAGLMDVQGMMRSLP